MSNEAPLNSSIGPVGESVPELSAFEERLAHRLTPAGIADPTTLVSDVDRQNQYDRLIALTGNTPFTRHSNNDGLILMKRLSQNPSECHYDRVYLDTLRKLEGSGVIWPSNRNDEHDGQRVELLELTSGSAGISFGFVTKMMGFEGTLFVPSEVEAARLHPMRSMGLNIEITPPGYVKAASDKLSERLQTLTDSGYKRVHFERDGDRTVILEKDGHRVCVVNHSENLTTLRAFGHVGLEMASYLPDGVSPDYLVLIIGNFTSATAISQIMRSKYPDMKIIGLESTENPNWFTRRYSGRYEEVYGHEPTFGPTRIYGTSQRDVRLFFANPAIFDEIGLFSPEDAIDFQARYNEGLPSVETIGRSTAAELMTAEGLTASEPGSIIMTINYDKGDRYDKFIPASLSNLDQDSLQPFGYRQPQLTSLEDIPTTLKETYKR